MTLQQLILSYVKHLQALFSSKVFNRRREQVLVFISWDVSEKTVFITF